MLQLITSGTVSHDRTVNGCPGVFQIPNDRATWDDDHLHPNIAKSTPGQGTRLLSLPISIRWNAVKNGSWQDASQLVSIHHVNLKWFDLDVSAPAEKPWGKRYRTATKCRHHNISGVALQRGESDVPQWPWPGQPFSAQYDSPALGEVWAAASGRPGSLVSNHTDDHRVYVVDPESGLPIVVTDTSFTGQGINCPWTAEGVLPGDFQTITGYVHGGVPNQKFFDYGYSSVSAREFAVNYSCSFCTSQSYNDRDNYDQWGHPYMYMMADTTIVVTISRIRRVGYHYYLEVVTRGDGWCAEGSKERLGVPAYAGSFKIPSSVHTVEVFPLVPSLVASFPHFDAVLKRYQTHYEPILVENAVAGANFGLPRSAANALSNIDSESALASNWLENWSQLPGGSGIPDLIGDATTCLATGDYESARKLIANAYLIYKYEVTTTIDDFNDVQAKAKSSAFRRALALGHKGLWRRGTYGFKPESLQTDCRTTFYLHWRGDPIATLFERMDSFGVNPARPENLWDLVPFSFVLDWFTDFGAHLTRISNVGYSEMFYKCLMRIDTVRTKQLLTPEDIAYLLPEVVPLSEIELSLFLRSYSGEFGNVSTEYLPSNDGLSVSQLLQGAALLVTQTR